ncbi:MAG: response regulator [Candidatus Hydrogenedentes bacterium]|nr:response regulator [Candidatus Hydrogenedentota bacterium]
MSERARADCDELTDIPVRILYVEDSDDDVFLVLRQLRRAGFSPTYTRVDTPSAMRQALSSGSWDVILSDYTMPQFSGRAALALRNEIARHIPFIAVSGTIGEDTAVEAMKNGMSNYVVKGSLARLAPAIRRELVEAANRKAQQEVEAELAEARERLSIVLKATNDAIYDWDLKTDRVWQSNVAGERFGRPSGDLDRGWWTTRIHPSDLERVRSSLSDAFAERQSKWSTEYRARRANEEWVHVLDRAFIIYDVTGKPARCIGSVLDLTEFRPLEIQLQQNQKMEAVSQLAGGIAHEFNNILTAVLGYSDILMSRLSPEDALFRDVKLIHEAGERAASLTRLFLNFSGKQAAFPVEMNLNTAVEDMSPALHGIAGADTNLVLILDPDLGRVKFDPFQIEQILVNLGTNARDAMPHGGTITIKSLNVELSATDLKGKPGLRPGPYAVLTFTDTGCGIDPLARDHVFEPFFSTKGVGKGTGLGLSYVYGVVKQNHGHVEFDSAPGKGTTFRIYLPQIESKALRAPAPPKAHESIESDTILVVEDDDRVLEVVARVLRAKGYEVLEAKNGSEALSLITRAEKPIHLMLTDLVMPTMGGIDLAKRVETLRPETRIVIMSGYNDRDSGGHEFLSKPISPETLLRKVREALSFSQKAG